MIVKVFGGAVYGINAITITIEVNILWGAKFIIVGLPDNAVKESQERIDSALREVGSKIPGTRVVINMAPADVKKEGSSYDLPLALGILAANEQLPAGMLGDYVVMGELSLDGSLQPVKGALPIAINAKREGFKGILLPRQNANEASVVNDFEVYGFACLGDVVAFLKRERAFSPVTFTPPPADARREHVLDFKDVKGQENVKRAMEIAAAGGHNLIMIGAPGSGKTMLARRLPTILPPMTAEESLETTKIHSVAGKIQQEASLIVTRPFRAPHHTVSDVALIGGGTWPQPGEVSLAHNGVLFLDELPEFKRSVLEVLRQPLEDRVICISRARSSVEFPANIMLIASMNPCPCGFYNHPSKECACAPGAVHKYLSKISGPLLDRIDMHVEVVPVEIEKIASLQEGEESASVQERVIRARALQTERFREHPGVYCNAQMTPALLKRHCELDDGCTSLLKIAMQRFGLSARAYDRIIKLARTIADLAGEKNIMPRHIAEAIQYRSLDREGWGG
jgi:magnesium chelatase family protein